MRVYFGGDQGSPQPAASSGRDYYVSWMKIINFTTTAVSLQTNHNRFNQGLFWDIFPIDYVDTDNVERDYQSIYTYAKRCGA